MKLFPAIHQASSAFFGGPIRAGFAMLALALCASTGLTARASEAFLPLVEPATQNFTPGKITYAQLTTPDLEQAKKFYGQLFGWTFKDMNVSHGRYAQVMVAGQNIASVVERPLPHSSAQLQPIWLPFISTADATLLAGQAKTWGGKIMFKPHDIPGLGKETIIQDPQGGLFAALQSSSGDPIDTEGPVTSGAWIWNSLLTPSPGNSAGFYQKLFSYRIEKDVETKSKDGYLLESQSFARATINPLPPHLPSDTQARWINFIQVDNVAQSAEQARKLGGKVLVEPHMDHNNSMIAIIADPAGAVLGIMEWRDATTAGEAK
ncbi:VOC family protein [Gluconobacter wancherniae]|uniref:VOC family protein n=1 Tax=Gluconobacter wancherniae TaxID=1307955 RepID=UPI001B8BABF0|nr:VOC family protein [Gluconobacter wancherniae]MBS1088057.1 VOC family protein [Gluconobacter wancherniae]